MATTAGAVSKVLIGSTTASVLSAAASGGTAPYTYQWYRSTTSGFTPGAGNLITGATALALSDTGLTPGVTYYYKIISIDAGAVSATSAQLEVGTVAIQQPNQFVQSKTVGMTDLRFNGETISVEVDASESGSLVAGQAVKIVDSAGGVPKVVACSANTDEVFGFINYSIKDQAFTAGMSCEISQRGNVMFLISTTTIARGVQVTLDLSYKGGVASAASSQRIVGYALDKASAVGQVIRVKLLCPSFATA